MEPIIKADLYRYTSKTNGLINFFNGLRYPGFRYMFFFRKASKYKNNSLPGIFYRWVLKRYSYKFGFQIAAGTFIGEGFYIGHFGTIVINPKVVIGKNCNIAHGVTIGQANRGKLKGFPTIGNYVWMGTNSIIVGNITIGSNVLIAPGSYVNFDVPDNTMVMGNPGKIIEKANAIDGYINNILNA